MASKLPDSLLGVTDPARVPGSDPLAWLNDLEGVPSGFAAARDGIDALLRDRGLRKTSPAQTADSLLRGAHASALLEGSESSWEEVQAGDGDEIAQAALRVSTGVLGLVPTLSTTPLQALARLHALAGAGVVGDDSLGRLIGRPPPLAPPPARGRRGSHCRRANFPSRTSPARRQRVNGARLRRGETEARLRRQ